MGSITVPNLFLLTQCNSIHITFLIFLCIGICSRQTTTQFPEATIEMENSLPLESIEMSLKFGIKNAESLQDQISKFK